MLKHNYGDIYLRRLKPTDKSESMMTAISMSAGKMLCEQHNRKVPIVAVRRGFPGEVMAVGYTKRELKARFLSGGRSWSETARFFRAPQPERAHKP